MVECHLLGVVGPPGGRRGGRRRRRRCCILVFNFLRAIVYDVAPPPHGHQAAGPVEHLLLGPGQHPSFLVTGLAENNRADAVRGRRPTVLDAGGGVQLLPRPRGRGQPHCVVGAIGCNAPHPFEALLDADGVQEDVDAAGRCGWRPCCLEEPLVLGAHVAPARQTDVEVERVKHLTMVACRLVLRCCRCPIMACTDAFQMPVHLRNLQRGHPDGWPRRGLPHDTGVPDHAYELGAPALFDAALEPARRRVEDGLRQVAGHIVHDQDVDVVANLLIQVFARPCPLGLIFVAEVDQLDLCGFLLFVFGCLVVVGVNPHHHNVHGVIGRLHCFHLCFLLLEFLCGQELLHIVKGLAKAREPVNGGDSFAGPEQGFEVVVMARAIQQVLCKGDVARLGRRQPVAPGQPFLLARGHERAVVLEARPEVRQPVGIAPDSQLDGQLVAKVADGVLLQQDCVHQATVAGLRTAAKALHGEVRGGRVYVVVLHHVVYVLQHPQGVLAGIPALGHDGLEAVHRIEGVGIP